MRRRRVAIVPSPEARSASGLPGASASDDRAVPLDLTESVVRDYLRRHPDRAYCPPCAGRAVGGDLPALAVSGVMAQLAGRRPPFEAGRCRCGAEGLMFVARR